MKRMLKYAALIATVLVICSSAWAATYTDHINTAPNNKGDMLIFPWYLALDGGWQTKLTVINTDEYYSVVAKVVIRSFKNSDELLDFLIYLTPADVWTGKIYFDTASGKVKIFSDDDSILTDTAPTWASATVPVDYPLYDAACADDGGFLGYIEVIEANYYEIDADGKDLPGPGVDKDALWQAHQDSSIPVATIDVLAGFMEVGNPVLGLSTTYPSTTFRDYENRRKLDAGDETKIGELCNNSMAEIEASFTKDAIAMPYVKGDNVALHFFTFPTKLTDFSDCADVTTSSPYFLDNMVTSGGNPTCIEYSLRTYDLTELYPTAPGSPFSGGPKSPKKYFCDEVNIILSSDFAYPEGWGRYIFSDSTSDLTLNEDPLSYAGAPVIPTFLYIGTNGLSGAYGAWTDSEVTDGLNALVDYQYTDLLLPD